MKQFVHSGEMIDNINNSPIYQGCK